MRRIGRAAPLPCGLRRDETISLRCRRVRPLCRLGALLNKQAPCRGPVVDGISGQQHDPRGAELAEQIFGAAGACALEKPGELD